MKIRILFGIRIHPKFIIHGTTVSEWIRLLIFKESLHINEISEIILINLNVFEQNLIFEASYCVTVMSEPEDENENMSKQL